MLSFASLPLTTRVCCLLPKEFDSLGCSPDIAIIARYHLLSHVWYPPDYRSSLYNEVRQKQKQLIMNLSAISSARQSFDYSVTSSAD
eukprot:scaffold25542_cov60-Cyclotella_meneghiniana.AAC.3